MRPYQLPLVPVLLLLLLGSCKQHYADVPTFSPEHKLLQVVVEMPAGTNHDQRYNPATNAFEPQQTAGLEAVVEFLPAPGNLGFVAGTRAGAAEAAPGSPLPVLVLAEAAPAGTVLEVLPVALLTLDIGGELQPVVVAVPARPAQRILPLASDWATLTRHYPGVRDFLNLWFRNRRHPAKTRIVGWKDEKSASQLIRRWMK
ncbi:inorganic diphosphatase [Hymenobacter rubripertinctus]|uniref:inorganic diphosphatase n=1 Tax=Hymenobacter rubripertinctus TaxID=2029981 RepID=A0A418QUA0_9BACT|nr:inorganic diphosphatase [Hymenobacter rubripertinctus]RIY08799.1 inorganic diphosphatase [Hymenobacter rubripertinctus]